MDNLDISIIKAEDFEVLEKEGFWDIFKERDNQLKGGDIAKWSEKKGITNKLLQLVTVSTYTNFRDGELNVWLKEELPSKINKTESILLYENIQKIPSKYLRAILLNILWKYRKSDFKEPFKVVELSLENYISEIEELLGTYPDSDNDSLPHLITEMLEYVLTFSIKLNHKAI